MALRRELMSYLGTGAVGGIFGYYARAQGLLGIKSTERTRTPTQDGTDVSTEEEGESTERETNDSSEKESEPADFDPFSVTIDSRATFLTKDSTDSRNPDPEIVNLENRNISAGDQIEFDVSGVWAAGRDSYDNPDNCRSVGVFSRTNELEGIEESNRVPGAIDTGEDIETEDTYNAGRTTDIPEDFEISGKENGQCIRQTVITVPQEAEYLFIGVRDSAYTDNRGELTFEIRPP